MMKRHPLDWYFILRPTLLIPVYTVFLAGYRLGNQPFSLLDWLIFDIAGIALGGAVYVFNECFDIESDRLNDKLHYLHQGSFSRKTALTYATILSVIGLVGLVEIAGARIGWIFTGFLVTGVLYNFPPFRLKDRAGGSFAVSVLGGTLTFWVALVLGNAGASFLPTMIAYSCAFGGVAIWTMIPDREGDAAVGKSTFAVRFGALKAARVGWFMVLAATCIAILVLDIPMLISGSIVSITAIPILKHENAARAAFCARLAILLLSITVGVYFPVYLLALLLYYFVARWYYRNRFSIVYPSLVENRW